MASTDRYYWDASAKEWREKGTGAAYSGDQWTGAFTHILTQGIPAYQPQSPPPAPYGQSQYGAHPPAAYGTATSWPGNAQYSTYAPPPIASPPVHPPFAHTQSYAPQPSYDPSLPHSTGGPFSPALSAHHPYSAPLSHGNGQYSPQPPWPGAAPEYGHGSSVGDYFGNQHSYNATPGAPTHAPYSPAVSPIPHDVQYQSISSASQQPPVISHDPYAPTPHPDPRYASPLPVDQRYSSPPPIDQSYSSPSPPTQVDHRYSSPPPPQQRYASPNPDPRYSSPPPGSVRQAQSPTPHQRRQSPNSAPDLNDIPLHRTSSPAHMSDEDQQALEAQHTPSSPRPNSAARNSHPPALPPLLSSPPILEVTNPTAGPNSAYAGTASIFFGAAAPPPVPRLTEENRQSSGASFSSFGSAGSAPPSEAELAARKSRAVQLYDRPMSEVLGTAGYEKQQENKRQQSGASDASFASSTASSHLSAYSPVNIYDSPRSFNFDHQEGMSSVDSLSSVRRPGTTQSRQSSRSISSVQQFGDRREPSPVVGGRAFVDDVAQGHSRGASPEAWTPPIRQMSASSQQSSKLSLGGAASPALPLGSNGGSNGFSLPQWPSGSGEARSGSFDDTAPPLSQSIDDYLPSLADLTTPQPAQSNFPEAQTQKPAPPQQQITNAELWGEDEVDDEFDIVSPLTSRKSPEPAFPVIKTFTASTSPRNSLSTAADREVYDYTLKVAFLTDRLAFRPAIEQQHFASGVRPPPATAAPAQNNRQSLLGADKLFNKLKNVGQHDSSVDKSEIFPSSATTPLKRALETIVKGAHPEFNDPRFVQASRIFKVKMDDHDYLKKFAKNNGRFGELILTFSGVAATVLREQHWPVDDFNNALDYQIGYFIKVLREAVKSTSGSAATVASLDAHFAELSINRPADAPPLLKSLPTQVADLPTVWMVGQLFGKTERELSRDVAELKLSCTERAAYLDAKILLSNVAAEKPYPGCRGDFDSDAAFNQWRREEMIKLAEVVEEIAVRNPSILQSPVTDAEISRLSFTYIPSDVKAVYRRLMDVILQRDAERPVGSHDPLDVMTEDHEALLRLCASRWRILSSYRVLVLLDAKVNHFLHNGLPLAAVLEELSYLDQFEENWPYARWPWADCLTLFGTLQKLFDALLPRLLDVFGNSFDRGAGVGLERVFANSVFRELVENLGGTLDDLKADLRRSADGAFEAQLATTASLSVLDAMLTMSSWVASKMAEYNKSFQKEVLGSINVPALFIGVTGPRLVQLLHTSQTDIVAAIEPAAGSTASDSPKHNLLRDLYEDVLVIKAEHDRYFAQLPFEVEWFALFDPLIQQFFTVVTTNLVKWMTNAIKDDNFLGDDETGRKHSTSIDFLGSGCLSVGRELMAFNWPSDLDLAKYVAFLGLRISQCIGGYANRIEKLFLADLSTTEAEIDADSSAFIAKAKLVVVGGESKIDAFVFTPQMLVKLNDVQAARLFLNTNMADVLRGEELARVQLAHQAPVDEATQRYLFTVKVVSTDRLGTSSPKPLDPFVAITPKGAERPVLATTRVLRRRNDPHWSQTFDISLGSSTWVDVTVYSQSEDLEYDDDIVGKAMLHLTPREFNNQLARDVWLPLTDEGGRPTSARILLRISVDIERDDVPFHFGKVSRTLKRMEKTMARAIINKMLPFVRGCLSSTNLQALVRKQFGINEQLGKVKTNLVGVASKVNFADASKRVNALWAGAFESDTSQRQLIPDVVEEHIPTDEELMAKRAADQFRLAERDREFEEQALAPITALLDYLYDTFVELTQALSAEAWDLVMHRLWKEILMAIESLLVPTLGDTATEMKPLSSREIDIVFLWLQALLKLLHSEGLGLPMTVLQNSRFQALTYIRMFYDTPTNELSETAVLSLQNVQTTRRPAPKRGNSVYVQAKIGTLRVRKAATPKSKESGPEDAELVKCESILKVLRMRSGQREFLRTQIMQVMQVRSQSRSAAAPHKDVGRGVPQAVIAEGDEGQVDFEEIPPVNETSSY